MNEYGTWSEWIWNEEYQKYYRQRQKPDGEYVFEWDGQASGVNAAQTPRDPSLEDDLARTLRDTHIHSPSAAYDNQNPEYLVASGSGRTRSKPTSKGKSKRSKGKAPASQYDDENTERDAWRGSAASQPIYDAPEQSYHDYDPNYGSYSHHLQQPQGMGQNASPEDDPSHSRAPLQQRFDHATQQYYDYPATPQQPAAHHYAEINPGYGYTQPGQQAGAHAYGYTQPGQQVGAHAYPDADPAIRQHYDHGHERRRRRRTGPTSPEPGPSSDLASRQYPEDYEEEEDPALAAALRESRRYGQGAAPAGESSSSTYGSYEEYVEDEGPPTPKAGMTSSHISATPGSEEILDPRYRIEPSYKFNPGEIFKVLWSEPQGNASSEAAVAFSERGEVKDKFGGSIYVGFRRFIVIANDAGHCTCVPILTYGGKACKKRGVKPDKHGIVYERGHRSKLLPGEPKLGFSPVKIQLFEDGEKLSKESRVNYSKLVTVEHNVKVMFVGRIVSSDWETVSEAVNKCWEDKIHHSKKYFDQ